MIQDDLALLELMHQDAMNQPPLYNPGPYWKGYANRIRSAIHTHGLAKFRSIPSIAKGYADVAGADPIETMLPTTLRGKIVHGIMKLKRFQNLFLTPYRQRIKGVEAQRIGVENKYLNLLLGDWFDQFRSKHELPDGMVGQPSDTVTVRDQTMGRCYLTAYQRIDAYAQKIDFSKIRTVFEIGGGFGAMPHILFSLFPNIRKYIYLDIPPMIYVGTQYLKSLFPDTVVDYSTSRDRDALTFDASDKREILAICPWQIEKLQEKIDLFWNAASFQEMPVSVVENYAKHIARCSSSSTHICLPVYGNGVAGHTIVPDELRDLINRETDANLQPISEQPCYENIDEVLLTARAHRGSRAS